ncbi:hypothetical protein B0E53_04357 [Micromonospora sp. MH33]|nr:hypothetical protein B0E53_04357 [Micromonospora sp. MH33]
MPVTSPWLAGPAPTAHDPEFAHHWPAYRWQSDHVERSRSLDEPPTGPLVVVPAERIVYTEHWLRREGYAPRQFWRAAGPR